MIKYEQKISRILAEPASAELRQEAPIDRGRWAVRLLWLGVTCSVAGMVLFLPLGWDAQDYLSVVRGGSSLPYSPLFTIPALGVARLLPVWLTVTLFAVAYFSGWLTQLWVGMQFATPEERRILRFVAPVIVFFPGLLLSDVILSGNLAFILYGLMLAGAAWGWKRGRWEWFYLAVLASACVKVHMLTMLALPLLCGHRQWRRAVAAGATGLSLFAVQSMMWPQAFQAYANSLKFMSQSRRDFGCGPVGNLARVLQARGVPYEKPCLLFYAIYAIALFALLHWLSRLYRAQRICFASWAPVMLLGVFLLDPRIQTYDVVPVSLPMALVAWRSLRDAAGKVRLAAMLGAVALLLACNYCVLADTGWVVMPDIYLQMLLMLGIFAAGVAGLLKEAGVAWPVRSASQAAESFAPESEQAAFEAADA